VDYATGPTWPILFRHPFPPAACRFFPQTQLEYARQYHHLRSICLSPQLDIANLVGLLLYYITVVTVPHWASLWRSCYPFPHNGRHLYCTLPSFFLQISLLKLNSMITPSSLESVLLVSHKERTNVGRRTVGSWQSEKGRGRKLVGLSANRSFPIAMPG